jgi:hypothetical protein
LLPGPIKIETVTSFLLPGPIKIKTVKSFSLLVPPKKIKRLHLSRYLALKIIETVTYYSLLALQQNLKVISFLFHGFEKIKK